MSSVDFLNADLDIESTSDLTPLIEELGESVIVMNYDKGGVNRLSLELAGVSGEPDDLVKEYGRLVNGLSDSVRLLWDGCSKRELDVGFECEGEVKGAPVGLTQRLTVESVSLLSKFGIMSLIKSL